MARSSITNVSIDPLEDSGSVLWSIVQGEQLEFPVVLNFVAFASNTYTFEAVVIEAQNDSLGTVPTAAKAGGVQTVLGVRVPLFCGTYDSGTTYQREDVVQYLDVFYKCLVTAPSNALAPNVNPSWEVHLPNTIYIQVPSTLGKTWTTQPTLEGAVYGLFELRVTEPVSAPYRRTWKPLRGMVAINYSPTELVADV